MTKTDKIHRRYINREISWLQFNARVLQEAADEAVPLIERIRFLGIFSNNLDEFFKVRYATIKRIEQAGKGGKNQLGGIKATELLEVITQTVIKLQSDSINILSDIKYRLKKEKIFIINESEINEDQSEFIKTYFYQFVSPALITIILNDEVDLPLLIDSAAYLAVRMTIENDDNQYALIEIPSTINRFVELPKVNGKDYIIMLDDLLRYFLNDIFSVFDYQSITAHMIKITRDAELDFDNDLSTSFLKKIADSVKHREIGIPVRFVYDKTIDKETLIFLMNKMGIHSTDSIIPGGRYHNRRDYMKFPSLGRQELLYDKIIPLPIKGLSFQSSIFQAISKKDYLLYAPYHTFSYVVKFLREAALDPKVKTIKITIYRLAKKNSHIASALINAAKNGKKVTVSLELQARFDESANIKYAQQMEAEGINLIFGVKGLKVHSKTCVIERDEGQKTQRYGFISTGNFNETTANLYTDYTLFTSDQKILKDVSKIFDFFDINYITYTYKHIINSPHYMQTELFKLIDAEISNIKLGKTAYIKLKMNSLSSYKMIDKLYEASNAGVKIQMIVRGLCCLIPGIPNMSENIEVISIVDKFLEHTRLFIFGNNNEPKVYISSADFMTRNIEHRLEVTCPIYDLDIKQELIDTFEICWSDNVKARIINGNQINKYKTNNLPKTRSQFETYNYYLEKLKN
jgi:polyphosphate kinase